MAYAKEVDHSCNTATCGNMGRVEIYNYRDEFQGQYCEVCCKVELERVQEMERRERAEWDEYRKINKLWNTYLMTP